MKIYYSSEFSRRYKRLPDDLKTLIKEKEKIFREDPHDVRLRTHKLKGKYKDFWSFSLDYNYRIVFQFYSKNEVRFYAIGDHSIYNK